MTISKSDIRWIISSRESDKMEIR
uniref:Uncharacterized protein n=1 Tax=Moniliophthora roreri TaxID=221103 RepID=A0A0W0F968_MONRR